MAGKENVPRLLLAWPTLLSTTHPSSRYKSSYFPDSRRFSHSHTRRFHAHTSCPPPQSTLHHLLPNHLRLPPCVLHLPGTILPSWNLHVNGPGAISTPNSDERLELTVIELRLRTLVTNARRSSFTWSNVWQNWKKRINDYEQAWVSLNSPPPAINPPILRENRCRPARTESSRRGSRV